MCLNDYNHFNFSTHIDMTIIGKVQYLSKNKDRMRCSSLLWNIYERLQLQWKALMSFVITDFRSNFFDPLKHNIQIELFCGITDMYVCTDCKIAIWYQGKVKIFIYFLSHWDDLVRSRCNKLTYLASVVMHNIM